MNRPIKFRAWVKPDNGIQHYSGMYEVKVLGLDAVLLKRASAFSPQEFPLEVIELMQFTGLLDKNGKEIYEGDIVMYPNDYPSQPFGDMPDPGEPHNDFSKIEYLNGAFGGRVIQSREKSALGNWMDIEQLADEYGDFEVIGNMWENKDLLPN